MAGRPKGLPKTGGRAKGATNKRTTELKEMILSALDGAGGVKYLQDQATANPASFLTLLGKVLPMQVAGDPENPISAKITVEYVRPK